MELMIKNSHAKKVAQVKQLLDLGKVAHIKGHNWAMLQG